MPALIHCARSGAHKARLAAMRPGEFIIAASRAEALSLYKAARRMSLRVSQQRLCRGNSALRVTLLPGGAT